MTCASRMFATFAQAIASTNPVTANSRANTACIVAAVAVRAAGAVLKIELPLLKLLAIGVAHSRPQRGIFDVAYEPGE